jgi:hypothetical protein
MRALVEMTYEFEEPFVLDTTKYQTTFGSAGTPLPIAVAATVDGYRGKTIPTTPAASSPHHFTAERKAERI